MTKGELLEFLKDLPDSTPINYTDPNYGGRGEELYRHCIEISYSNGYVEVYIDVPMWEPVD